jgi:hypothetical protein
MEGPRRNWSWIHRCHLRLINSINFSW